MNHTSSITYVVLNVTVDMARGRDEFVSGRTDYKANECSFGTCQPLIKLLFIAPNPKLVSDDKADKNIYSETRKGSSGSALHSNDSNCCGLWRGQCFRCLDNLPYIALQVF
nr:hypothetical transcript [Hymenolepis microstoma]